MDSTPERRLGQASTLLGLSEIGAFALDAIGRWQLLADLSTLPLVRAVVNPYAAAAFIFIGSLLVARGREKEFEEAFKNWSTPVLYGVNRVPPKKPSAWKMPLLLVALAAIIAVIFMAGKLMLYVPPEPKAAEAFIENHDELLKDVKRPVRPSPRLSSPVQNCPGGICAGGDITGDAQVNNYNAKAWALTGAQAKDLKDALTGTSVSFDVCSSVDEGEAARLGGQLTAILASAGWTQIGTGPNYCAMDFFEGVVLRVSSAYLPPVKTLQTKLVAFGIPAPGAMVPEVPLNAVQIRIGHQPKPE
jgi:hypothetical protein